jgi:hypothetical protein
MPRADRQLAYIESCSYPPPSFSSLLSLVSSISAIYKADYSAFCTCRHTIEATEDTLALQADYIPVEQIGVSDLMYEEYELID